jgi:putative copper export protein
VDTVAFIVRLVHVGSASLLFGGALLIFILLRLSKRKPGDSGWDVIQDVMRIYEWAAWVSLGLIVATGIGNLGHYGDALPGPRTEWGRELTVKLALVLIFLVVSAVRTLTVLMAAGDAASHAPARLAGTLRNLYGATAVFVAGIVALAVSLAHF